MESMIRNDLRKFKDDVIMMTRRTLAEKLFTLPQSEARDRLIRELEQ